MNGYQERADRLLMGLSYRRVERRHAAWWNLGEERRWNGEPVSNRALNLYMESHTTAGRLRRASGWILERER